MNALIGGIDFGTSNSTVGIVKNGTPQLVALEKGQVTLPSAIFYNFEDNQTYYGRHAISEYMEVDREEFESKLGLFILFRLLQILGAYGFRGLVENKAAFVVSIPLAMNMIREQLAVRNWPYPYLKELLGKLADMPRFQEQDNSDGRLHVKVCSFSFKKGLPYDLSGNGGGYIFDCRSIHNPGRYEPYKKITGMDEPVIRFLEDDGEVFRFMEHVYGVVDPHVETYARRGFTSLMVSFGCTGGQHRSVYCAESLARHLSEKYPDISVSLEHREQNVAKRY